MITVRGTVMQRCAVNRSVGALNHRAGRYVTSAIVVALLAVSPSVGGDDAVDGSSTLPQLVAEVLRNNKDLQAARYTLDMGKARLVFSRVADLNLSFLPYNELRLNRETMARFGSGLKPLLAVGRTVK